jgi:hypothetical protein
MSKMHISKTRHGTSHPDTVFRSFLHYPQEKYWTVPLFGSDRFSIQQTYKTAVLKSHLRNLINEAAAEPSEPQRTL